MLWPYDTFLKFRKITYIERQENKMIKTRLVKLLSNSKKYIYLNIIVQWVSLVAQILAIFLITSFIADVFDNNGFLFFTNDSVTQALFVNTNKITYNLTALGIVLFTLCLLIAIRMIAAKLLKRISFLASVNVKKLLRDRIYDKLLRLGPSYKEQISTAELVQLETEGVEQLETYFAKYLPQLFYSLIAPITLFLVLYHISLKASLLLLIFVPLIPISIVIVQKIAKRLLSKYWDAYAKLGDSFLDNLNALTSLKLYMLDEIKQKEMDEEASNFRKITMKVLTMQLNSTSVMDIVAYGGAAVGMVVTIKEYFNGNIGLAGALSIILLASEFFIPLRLLGSYFHIAMNGMAASDKIFNLLDMPEPKQGNKELAKSDKASLSFMKHAKAESIFVNIENLKFSYDNNRQILDGLDLTLPAGSFISLVGESGSGKSTVASLITAKHKNFTGSIKINGLNISDIKPESLASNITLVGTNSYIFTGTIRDNLLMAKSDASDEELLDALEKVNLKNLVMLRDGLDTKINERATNLSGGQAQRLCVARAFLADTPMYIFDEATSNIDAESEEIIMRVIKEIAKTKTVLLISHRLKNVVDSDCIYMLDKGRIVEAGKHQELILNVDDNKTKDENYGAYARLFDAQAKLENFKKKSDSEIKVIDARAGVCLYDDLNKDRAKEIANAKKLEEERRQKEEIELALKEKQLRAEALNRVHNKLYETKSYVKKDYYDNIEYHRNLSYRKNSLEDELDNPNHNMINSEIKKPKEISNLALISKLASLTKPLMGIMGLAILLGSVGYLAAISLSIIASGLIVENWGSSYAVTGLYGSITCGLTGKERNVVCIILIIIAVLRGFLHYAEQYCNHYIAFKLLAIIRHKVFENLRRLAPAKLDNKERGNLISIITSDIELLEVFYAHTISPVAIAFIVSLISVIFLAHYSMILGVIAAVAYIIVAVIIPLVNGKLSSNAGEKVRDIFGQLNSLNLDSIRGIDETIQYGDGLNRRLKLAKESKRLSFYQEDLANYAASSSMVTEMVILVASYLVFVVALNLAGSRDITFANAIVATVTMMSSFGPCVALSSLSNNLNQTFASAKRVISIIEEEPETKDVLDGKDLEILDEDSNKKFKNKNEILVSQLSFAYNDKEILRDYNAVFEAGKITGIHGESGCGKSTLLKLIMRYFKPNKGEITIAGTNLDQINTASLRTNIAFVSQETELINDTIAANIAFGKYNASREEIIEAAKRASIHEFIQGLDNSYDTVIGELGERLSSGEKQRIGLARAFLSDAPIILLDEPTSNLDSLNEGIILESLSKMAKGKTIIIVSHRESTMNAVDTKIIM